MIIMRREGFTLIETSLAIAIIATLFGFITLNLLSGKESATQSTTLDIFISDLRHSQLKAMVGDAEGRVDKDSYGVYIEPTSYTLFHGSTYNSSDPTNRTVNLGDNETFSSVQFAGNLIQFASMSGELVGFVPGANNLSIRNGGSGSQKDIQINKYGVVFTTN